MNVVLAAKILVSACKQHPKMKLQLVGLEDLHTCEFCLIFWCDARGSQVGAALSMVYESGAPIMFVGCGQTYTDIRKLNVKQIVNSLLR